MTAIEAALLALPLLLIVMLVPAALEVRRPKDAGPRFIIHERGQASKVAGHKAGQISDLEELHELDVSLKPFVKVILGNLPALEV